MGFNRVNQQPIFEKEKQRSYLLTFADKIGPQTEIVSLQIEGKCWEAFYLILTLNLIKIQQKESACYL